MFFIGGDWKNRIFSRPVKGEELTRKNMVCRSATWCKILAYIHVQFTCLWNCKTTLIQYKDNQINYYMHNINMNDMICIYMYNIFYYQFILSFIKLHLLMYMALVTSSILTNLSNFWNMWNRELWTDYHDEFMLKNVIIYLCYMNIFSKYFDPDHDGL